MTPTLSTIRDPLDRASTTTAEGTVRHVYDGIHCIADLDEAGAVLRTAAAPPPH